MGGRRVAALGGAAVVLAGAGVAYAATGGFGNNKVGTEYANGLQVSDNQILKPLGDRLVTEIGKFMGSTVSPDGRFLAASATDRSVALQIFDLSSYKLIWTAGTATGVNQRISGTTVGQEGPTYSPDGKFLWLPQQTALARFPVNADGTLGAPTNVAIPTVSGHAALVGQTAYSPDGSTLYAAINGQNTVVAINPSTGAVTRTWNVGIAPRQLSFVGNMLYVSNEGGRRAQAGDTTMDSYGTAVPADPYKGTSTTGTVSVIDTANPSAAVGSIDVGLHPTAMFLKGNALFVANTNDDTVSVIDTTKNTVVQTIETKPWPSSKVGYHPTSVAMTADGHLLVTLGRANAVAVYQFHGDPKEPVNFIGLLPTDYYPKTIATVGEQVFVTNTRGIDARGPNLSFSAGAGTTPAVGHGTHSTTASLTRFTLPTDTKTAEYTATVFAQNDWRNEDVRQQSVGGTVPSTLALSIGAPAASFGAFTPGVAKTYDTSLTADVVSTAGDAALSWSGPDHLTNGAFSMAQPFTVDFSKSIWNAPVSHDPVTIGFHQPVAATDPLRSGNYAATVTFTLSTTTPGYDPEPTPAPVPVRVGDPSPIKHVFMIVKENRTYDQVYGDMPEGNGDATLAQFGAKVTPNQHALARQFGLYDNTYDVGTNSAEGHNWLMQGDNPEYTESSAGEYQRSYDTEEDVLGHQRSGFLWTAVQDAGNTARNYGEFIYTEGKPSGGTWQQYYCAYKGVENGGDPALLTASNLKGNYGSVIPSLNTITNPTSPPYDLSVPDMYRYQIWKQDFEKNGPANFNMIWYSSDHTGGPTNPVAGVADGDLAVGKMVDAISHSKYWKDSAIFVVEDDSQAGADHVDGHRAPIQIISPWAQHGKVDSTYYSQVNMVRTIEQILGAQPLNQKVAAATPMYSAFTDKPDYTPFNAVPNQVPLTQGISTAPACGLDTLGQTAAPAAAQAPKVPAEQSATAAAWQAWIGKQRTTGNGAVADYANPEQMNRFTWYEAHAWKVPYPGDPTLFAPDEVPGAYIPSADTN
ncbi:MAG TPA: alkaline phosphatase family protein [Solirubrobacter sp.]